MTYFFAVIATWASIWAINMFLDLIGRYQRGAIGLPRIKLSGTQLTELLPASPAPDRHGGLRRRPPLGLQLQAPGHDVRLIPAQYVKPFLKGHKNDYRDAEAIAEAVQRPTMSFVAIKTPGADGSACLAPGALASGQPAHGRDQPDPRLPSRARHHRAPGACAPAAVLARHSGFVRLLMRSRRAWSSSLLI